MRGCTTCRVSWADATDTPPSESATMRSVRRIEANAERFMIRSEPVGLLRQTIGEIDRGLGGLVLGKTMLGDEAREKGAVAAARGVVARRNRQERPGVVVEADGVVEARRLRRLLAEAAQTLGTVVKPPGGTELEHRIVAGERRQLPAVV